jgi:hypothetical protein
MTESRGGGDRGLSDVLGYIIVFSLVVSAVLLVTAGGLAALEDARDAEQTQNAERAFDVIADNFASIYERNAPSRSSEIDLGNSELSYGNNVTVTVLRDDQELLSRSVRPVRMRVVDGRTITYEGGAVFRRDGENIGMVRPPPFLLSGDRVHLPLIQTTAPTIESAAGTTVLLRGVSDRRDIIGTSDAELSGIDGVTDLTGLNDITIQVTSPRFEAWGRYFTNEGLSCVTRSSAEEVECTLDLGSDYSAYVMVQSIRLSLVF